MAGDKSFEERQHEYVTVGRDDLRIEGEAEIIVGPDGGFKKVGKFGGFTLHSDEGPGLLGGEGTAPRPWDYFLAALAF
ncbi:MAG: hypothetical protein V3V06_08345 [Dehalococcoidia bacterium]